MDCGHVPSDPIMDIATIPVWETCQIYSRFLETTKKMLDKIMKILETQSELIHMLTCYKLLLI